MRGGAQAYLIEADDSCSYIVKFAENPQGRRILVNELVSSLLMRKLGILTAVPALVLVDEKFIRENPEVYLGRTDKKQPVRPGVHFGSQHPCPLHNVWDFLPDVMLPELCNRDHFFGALVADRWLSNADGRQAIFYQARVTNPFLEDEPTVRWVTSMIDQGFTFQGPAWSFEESSNQGIYCRRAVYGSNPTMRDVHPWLERLVSLSRDTIDEAFGRIPACWIAGEESEFAHLLVRLNKRRERIRTLVAQTIKALREKNQCSARESEFRQTSIKTLMVDISPPLRHDFSTTTKRL